MTTSERPCMSFPKKERITSKKLVEQLFCGTNRSMVAFPIRMVYMPTKAIDVPVQVLTSVSKRHFKHAVKRNRVKRQIREAYRKTRNSFVESIANTDNHYTVAFIYLADDIKSSDVIDGCIDRLMKRLGEKIAHEREVEKGDVKANEGC